MSRSVWLIRFAALFTFLFSLLALWAFLTPINALPPAPDISDFIWHVAIFVVLVVPLASTLPNHGNKIAFAAVIFGTGIEIAQPYFGRGFEVGDLLANMIGSGTGWYCARWLRAVFRRHAYK